MAPTPWQARGRTGAGTAAETVGAVAAATGLVAVLDEVAPVTGLGVLYLLAVLFIAIRRGEVAALATAVLSVMTLNFLFIEPRYHLTIADSRNVVALTVFLIAAVVVGRLAASAQAQAARADDRARLAVAREREAKTLAEAASALLAAHELEDQLAGIGESVEASTGSSVRLGLTGAPSPRPGEAIVGLPAKTRPGWLYGRTDEGWGEESLRRIGEALAALIDVAVERARMAAQFAEAEAGRRADVAKTALLHAISHDLRSPLTAIATAASALRASDVPGEDRDALLAAIDAESARLGRLVDDLLDLSRIEAGAVNPQLDWCELGDAVSRAAAQVEARHGGRAIEVTLPSDLPLVMADPVQVERVFANLIDNAVKFSPPESAVRISGGTGGNRVVVRVTDLGPGIPASRRSRVFEPFFRGREGSEGSGLGLAICKGFVDANGGELRLQADPSGATSFAVAFPLLSQPVAQR